MKDRDRTIKAGCVSLILLCVLSACGVLSYIGSKSDSQTQAVRAALTIGMTRDKARELAYEHAVAYHCLRENEDLYLFVTSYYHFGLGTGLRLRFRNDDGQYLLEEVWDLEDSALIGGELSSCQNEVSADKR